MKLNFKIIFHFFGLLLLFNGGFMLLAAIISYAYSDGVTLNISLSGILVIAIGIVFMLLTKKHEKEINKREGYLVVAFGWVIMTLSGTLPYILTSSIPSFTNAFFETKSGYTTTGSTILNDIESDKTLPDYVDGENKEFEMYWSNGDQVVLEKYENILLTLNAVLQETKFTAEFPGDDAYYMDRTVVPNKLIFDVAPIWDQDSVLDL